MNQRIPITEDLFFAYGKEIEGAFRQGVREALLRHKKLGQSVAVWRDGKVVILSPEEIPVGDSFDCAEQLTQQS